jgi:hypothetical protein
MFESIKMFISLWFMEMFYYSLFFEELEWIDLLISSMIIFRNICNIYLINKNNKHQNNFYFIRYS